MILDLLENWTAYLGLPAWREAMEFTVGLAPDAADGDYDIRGRDIWARVSSYSTLPLADAVLEAHREYVDIQAPLMGEEFQGCYPVGGLRPRTAYDPADDVLFFDHPAALTNAWLLRPGMFAVFFPQDAHMNKGQVGTPALVKKVVVKVRAALLRP